MYVPPSGLPCNPIVKITGSSTLAGAAVWLGKSVTHLNFQYGFLFSTLSLISIKIHHKMTPMIEANFRMPIVRGTIHCMVAFGIPIAIMHQITPLNVMQASCLTMIAIASRQVFRVVTDRNPFL